MNWRKWLSLPIRFAVAAAFQRHANMLKCSNTPFALAILAITVVLLSDTDAQDASTKRDDPKVILEGKVIDDQVVDERGKLIAGATVRAMYASKVDYDSTPENVTTASDGTFKLMRKERPLYLKATTPDQRQAGIVRVEADQRQATIRVAPLARATGQVVDKIGKPVQLGYILYLVDNRDPDPLGAFGMFTAGIAILDSDGRFTMNGLLPGQRYSSAFMARGGATSDHLGYVVPPSAGEFNLDTLSLPKVRFTRLPEPTVRLVVDNPQDALQRQQKLSKLLTASLANTPYDLVVQRAAGTNESANFLPEDLAENLLQVNGVKRFGPRTLDCALLDLVSFEKESLTGVLASGWLPRRCPLFVRFKFQPGGRPLKDDDENMVVLGQELAAKLGKKVGDKIELYGRNQFLVVGIYESPVGAENQGLVVRLEDLQRVMAVPREVTGFAIAAQQPIDKQGLEDLRQRLEAVQPGLEVAIVRQPGNDQTPKSQPDRNMHSGDQNNP
jgi:hypothetical protein